MSFSTLATATDVKGGAVLLCAVGVPPVFGCGITLEAL